MKKAMLKFAESLISKEQMKAIKGGVVYCNCPIGGWLGFPDIDGPNNYNCAYRCANT